MVLVPPMDLLDINMIKISSIFWAKPRFIDPHLVPIGKEYGCGLNISSCGYLDGSGTGFGYNNQTYDSGIGFGFGTRKCRGAENGRGYGIGCENGYHEIRV